jgi:hypothetical protein
MHLQAIPEAVRDDFSDDLDPGNAAPQKAHHSIIYLAAPYSDLDEALRLQRYKMATSEAARLASAGYIVFSPLTLTHPLDVLLAGSGGTLGSSYWLNYDEAFMEFCSELFVLRLEGWQTSAGVQREIAFFARRGRPISFLDPAPIPV